MSPDEIINLHRSGYLHGVPPSPSWSGNTDVSAQWTKEAITGTLGLEDYSTEVETLLADPDVIWKSGDWESFRKNGKINFLRITDDWIILDIFKPGCHREKQLRINQQLRTEIKSYLTQHPFTKWDDVNAGWENGANQDSPNGVFSFHREKRVWGTLKLVWKGKHTNPQKTGMPFSVEDTFEPEFV